MRSEAKGLISLDKNTLNSVGYDYSVLGHKKELKIIWQIDGYAIGATLTKGNPYVFKTTLSLQRFLKVFYDLNLPLVSYKVKRFWWFPFLKKITVKF